jgi:type I restriction enzyme S subunit
LYHGLQQWDLLQGVDQAIKGATLNKAKLKRIAFDFPEAKPEQSKIAEILSTVHRAIEQTEALIAKQQRIKTGLMQDLLTRGIDEHSKLRSEDTHEFKDSPLGRIPIEWEIGQLADVLAGTPRNGIYKPAGQIGSGTLMIGQTSFTPERRIDYRLARRAEISKPELSAYGLWDDDILVTRVFATVGGVGRPVLVSGLPEPAVYESNMLRLRIDRNKMHPTLLFYWLMSSWIRKLIGSAVNASNQTSVNQKVLNELPVLIPPRNEQVKLVETIATQEQQLAQNESYNHKLRALKIALMQDLLTGKKRVTPLLESESKPEKIYAQR